MKTLEELNEDLQNDVRHGYLKLQDFILGLLEVIKTEYEEGKTESFLLTSQEVFDLSGGVYSPPVYSRALRELENQGKIIRRKTSDFEPVFYCLVSCKDILEAQIRHEESLEKLDLKKQVTRLLQRHGLDPKIKIVYGKKGLFIPEKDLEKLLSLLSRI